MNYQHLSHDKGGSFLASDEATIAGKLTYVWKPGDVMAINHTEVNEQYNGQGIGKMMVMQAVAYARENGFKIIPVCPFVKKVFEKVTDIQDVLA